MKITKKLEIVSCESIVSIQNISPKGSTFLKWREQTMTPWSRIHKLAGPANQSYLWFLCPEGSSLISCQGIQTLSSPVCMCGQKPSFYSSPFILSEHEPGHTPPPPPQTRESKVQTSYRKLIQSNRTHIHSLHRVP